MPKINLNRKKKLKNQKNIKSQKKAKLKRDNNHMKI